MTNDVGALALENRDAELVLAFVSPLGTPLDGVQEAVSDGLHEHGYSLGVLVHISKLLDETQLAPQGERPAARQERLMKVGTDLRRTHGGDYLALMAIANINATRAQGDRNEMLPHRHRAHVIRSLKHPDEVTRLRHVYGKGFFLLGVSAPRSLRRDTLIERNFPLDEANRLLDKDAAEDEKIGQQTRETFQLADAYLWIDGDEGDRIGQQVRRILDLLFSCPFHPPTPEEHAMFMAYAAALRSSDLSRQVGAVVANRLGDVVASGANEAPAPNGGTYWPPRIEFDGATNELEGPDYLRGFDSNERERNRILARVITKLVPDEVRDQASGDKVDDMSSEARSALIAKYKDRLEGTGILDLTEFGRAVHAELAALMSCARSGVTPVGGTLYCTTFPCHNCAKHIISSGITRVIYVEPYAKSKAKELHADAIVLPHEDERRCAPDDRRVEFRAFEGIGPRRFVDLFSLTLGNGRPVSRKAKGADGVRSDWKRGEGSSPRLPLDPRSYLDRETADALYYRRKQTDGAKLIQEGTDGPHQAEGFEANHPDPPTGSRRDGAG